MSALRAFVVVIIFQGLRATPWSGRPRPPRDHPPGKHGRHEVGEKNICLSDGTKIRGNKVCDGRFDCPDLSDEFLCPRSQATGSWNKPPPDFNPEQFNINDTSKFASDIRHTVMSLFGNYSKQPRENAMNFIRRTCIPHLTPAESPVVDPCDFCKQGDILCSHDPLANQSGVPWPSGKHFQTCVSKSQVCDGLVQCRGADDELHCDFKKMSTSCNVSDFINLTSSTFNLRSEVEFSGDMPFEDDEFSHITKFLAGRVQLKAPPCFLLLKKYLMKRQRPRDVSEKKIGCALLSLSFKGSGRRGPPGKQREDDAVRPNFPHGPPHSFFSGPPPPHVRHPPHQLLSLMRGVSARSAANDSTISKKQICDGLYDCPDMVDESNCPDRFYCESGSPFYVNNSAVMDGVADCDDESDEWPQNYGQSTLASKDRMVKDISLLMLMWLIGTVAALGNAVVVVSTIISLIGLHKIPNAFGKSSIRSRIYSTTRDPAVKSSGGSATVTNPVKTCGGSPISGAWGRKRTVKLWNRALVLNLALSDFLMGCYLLSLGGISATLKNGYWSVDKTWRTSFSCQILGVVVVVSSQTSVFSLVGLTTLRLYTVVKPFAVKHLKTWYLVLLCSLMWTISIFLAVLPTLPGVQYHYATEAWVPFPHFRPPVINRTQADTLTRLLADLTNDQYQERNFSEGTLLWREMLEYTRSSAPDFADWKFFGYYSAHSVCIPKLYVTTGDVAWQHTAAFLAVNFAAVVYICIAYSTIYYMSTKTRKIVFRGDNTVMDNSFRTGKRTPAVNVDATSGGSNEGERSPRSVMFDLMTCQICCTKPEQIRIQSRVIRSSTSSDVTKPDNVAEIQVRIALLVATDCLCWIPICIMGFLKLANFDIPVMAYSVSAIGLLPINSALNPLLYSRFLQQFARKLWVNLLRKIKDVFNLITS